MKFRRDFFGGETYQQIGLLIGTDLALLGIRDCSSTEFLGSWIDEMLMLTQTLSCMFDLVIHPMNYGDEISDKSCVGLKQEYRHWYYLHRHFLVIIEECGLIFLQWLIQIWLLEAPLLVNSKQKALLFSVAFLIISENHSRKWPFVNRKANQLDELLCSVLVVFPWFELLYTELLYTL